MDGIPTSVAASVAGALGVRPGQAQRPQRQRSPAAGAPDATDVPPEATDAPVEGMEETPRLFEQLPSSPPVRPRREKEERAGLDLRA